MSLFGNLVRLLCTKYAGEKKRKICRVTASASYVLRLNTMPKNCS